VILLKKCEYDTFLAYTKDFSKIALIEEASFLLLLFSMSHKIQLANLSQSYRLLLESLNTLPLNLLLKISLMARILTLP